MKSLLILLALAGVAHAKVKTEVVTYKQGSSVLEGYLAYDDAQTGKRPGVLVVHAWMGLDDNAKKRTEMLAGLGYVAFAADIYGKGVRPKDKKEAAEQAGKYKGDRALLRQRVNAAFDTLIKNPKVDPTKTAAIGYCFGGTTVLELARSGTKVGAVASFHGGLDSPTPADGKKIKAKVLVLHGVLDAQKPESIEAFKKEMIDGNVDFQMIEYGGATHCFTHKDAGSDVSSGCAYNAAADARSWAAMRALFDETFGKK